MAQTGVFRADHGRASTLWTGFLTLLTPPHQHAIRDNKIGMHTDIHGCTQHQTRLSRASTAHTQTRHRLQNTARENEGPGCPKTPPTHTYLEGLEHARIISAINHVLAPRAARMRSCQGWVVASAACASNKGVGRPEWAGTPARTSGRSRFLAVLEDHPSPAARPGPIHGMGRAVCGPAHALRGWSRVASAKSSA